MKVNTVSPCVFFGRESNPFRKAIAWNVSTPAHHRMSKTRVRWKITAHFKTNATATTTNRCEWHQVNDCLMTRLHQRHFELSMPYWYCCCSLQFRLIVDAAAAAAVYGAACDADDGRRCDDDDDACGLPRRHCSDLDRCRCSNRSYWANTFLRSADPLWRRPPGDRRQWQQLWLATETYKTSFYRNQRTHPPTHITYHAIQRVLRAHWIANCSVFNWLAFCGAVSDISIRMSREVKEIEKLKIQFVINTMICE